VTGVRWLGLGFAIWLAAYAALVHDWNAMLGWGAAAGLWCELLKRGKRGDA
jgi:hypothetical protein